MATKRALTGFQFGLGWLVVWLVCSSLLFYLSFHPHKGDFIVEPPQPIWCVGYPFGIFGASWQTSPDDWFELGVSLYAPSAVKAPEEPVEGVMVFKQGYFA